MLIGFGTFTLVEGIVDHHVLGLHHVNETVPRDQWIWWNLTRESTRDELKPPKLRRGHAEAQLEGTGEFRPGYEAARGRDCADGLVGIFEQAMGKCQPQVDIKGFRAGTQPAGEA